MNQKQILFILEIRVYTALMFVLKLGENVLNKDE